MYSRRSVSLNPGDQKILADTMELSRQLGIRKTIVREVSWADKIGLARMAPDMIAVYKGDMLIHKSLMDKLSSDELKPLIASTLLHREWIGRTALRGILGYMAPAFLAMYIIVYIVEHTFSSNTTTAETAIFVSILFGLGIVLLAMRHIFRSFTRVWYNADTRTAQLLGKDMFLSVLAKMDAMGFGRGKPMREQPSVRDRITNLRKSLGPESRSV
jgi:F0F1-type ATP synthase assembly protein I